MKLPYVAAAALLLGTSALAWAPEGPKDTVPMPVPGAEVKPAPETKIVDPAPPVETPKLQPASFSSWAEPDTTAGDPNLDLTPKPDDVSAGIDPEASDTGMADTSDAGVGGPIETADAAAAPLDLAPRAASQNYPACRPGPGDDNCIQLYEPGVRVALASWTQPTGGLSNGEPQVAMGGPDEPIADDAVNGTDDIAMNGDNAVDPAAGEATAEGLY